MGIYLPLRGKEDRAEIGGFEFIAALILNSEATFMENYRNKVGKFIERV